MLLAELLHWPATRTALPHNTAPNLVWSCQHVTSMHFTPGGLLVTCCTLHEYFFVVAIVTFTMYS